MHENLRALVTAQSPEAIASMDRRCLVGLPGRAGDLIDAALSAFDRRGGCDLAAGIADAFDSTSNEAARQRQVWRHRFSGPGHRRGLLARALEVERLALGP